MNTSFNNDGLRNEEDAQQRQVLRQTYRRYMNQRLIHNNHVYQDIIKHS